MDPRSSYKRALSPDDEYDPDVDLEQHDGSGDGGGGGDDDDLEAEMEAAAANAAAHIGARHAAPLMEDDADPGAAAMDGAGGMRMGLAFDLSGGGGGPRPSQRARAAQAPARAAAVSAAASSSSTGVRQPLSPEAANLVAVLKKQQEVLTSKVGQARVSLVVF